MNIRDFTREDIPRAIVRLLRSGICFDYASDYAEIIESRRWLDDEIWEMIEHNERLD